MPRAGLLCQNTPRTTRTHDRNLLKRRVPTSRASRSRPCGKLNAVEWLRASHNDALFYFFLCVVLAFRLLSSPRKQSFQTTCLTLGPQIRIMLAGDLGPINRFGSCQHVLLAGQETPRCRGSGRGDRVEMLPPLLTNSFELFPVTGSPYALGCGIRSQNPS